VKYSLKSTHTQFYATDWMTGIRYLVVAMTGHFSLHDCVQTETGTHPDSYPMDIGDYYK